MTRMPWAMAARHHRHCQQGASLIEMMLALTLAGMVIAAAVALLSSAFASMATQSGDAELRQRGAFALAALRRSLQLAGYRNWDGRDGSVVSSVETMPAVYGRDDCAFDVHACQRAPNRSDLIEIRHDGAGASPGDGSIIDCAGRRVAGTGGTRVRSVFYVAASGHGELALYCRYGTDTGMGRAEALIEGVENFQVLYGVDMNGDGVAEQFLAARAMSQADWPRVTAVMFALVLRGPSQARLPVQQRQWALFDPRYTAADGAFMPPRTPRRLRYRVTATVLLPNRSIHVWPGGTRSISREVPMWRGR